MLQKRHKLKSSIIFQVFSKKLNNFETYIIIINDGIPLFYKCPLIILKLRRLNFAINNKDFF